MPDYATLHAEQRTVTGKAVRHLRRAGVTPIVVYGAHTAPQTLQANTRELLEVLRRAGGTHLITVDVEGETKPRMVLTREVQRHVTKLTPLHVDFLEVDVHERVTSVVPVVVEGVPELVDVGTAILDLMVAEITVEALPTDLPSSIVIDAARLVHMDDAVHLRDLDAGAKVRILGDPDELVLRLAASRVAALEEEEAAAAPEVPLVKGPEAETD